MNTFVRIIGIASVLVLACAAGNAFAVRKPKLALFLLAFTLVSALGMAVTIGMNGESAPETVYTAAGPEEEAEFPTEPTPSPEPQHPDLTGTQRNAVWDAAAGVYEAEISGSTSVNRVTYDPAQAVLFVEFHQGAGYNYYEVEEEVFLGLLDAESVGKYINSAVKGTYEYERVSG